VTREGPRITGTRRIPPDPAIARAVGRHHSFETAVADLIDNSIDAGATHLLVRFIQSRGAIVGLRVIDNGRGMSASDLDGAMTFARQRDYEHGELGHFGVGLKAASLSQAEELRVYSQKLGATPAGASIEARDPTSVSTLDVDDVAHEIDQARSGFALGTGTIVEWSRTRTFLTSADAGDRARWIEERMTSLLAHLGLVFHRLLSTDRILISCDIFDRDSGSAGIPRRARPIDPFGYNAAMAAEPAELRFEIGGVSRVAKAHVWPAAQSGGPNFRLGGRPGTLFQGFFFYRGDRLVQAGGWNTLTVARPELEYARVSIDLDEELLEHVALNPEKAGLELNDNLRAAIRNSRTADGEVDFARYLQIAEGDRAASRQYTKRAVELMRPDRGFGPEMIAAVRDSVELSSAGELSIRWRVMDSESPFDVDVERRTIWLNEQYRALLAPNSDLDPDDAPFVKTLLLIAFSRYFDGSYLGTREKAEISAWDQILTAALREELAQQARRMSEE